MDAFISYRHKTGGVYALEIYKFLVDHCNMNVFFDKDGLYQYVGDFPKVLEEKILNSDNFILILTDLNIDNYDNSVYIQEISLAIKEKKRIIVVKGNDFKYPDNLHPTISSLPNIQSLDINDAIYFNSSFRVDLLAKMKESEKRNKAYYQLISDSKLESRLKIESRLSLSERLNSEVISVDMCATACRGFLSNASEHLERLLKNGSKFRVIINTPDSPAALDAYEKKIAGGSVRQRMRILPQAYEDLLDWQTSYPGLFQGRTTDEFLPCAIFIIHTKNPQKDTIKVDYYSFLSHDTERRSVLISSGDSDNFNFYIKQFEWLWEQSKPVE